MAGRRRSILALCLLSSSIIASSSAVASETVEYGYDARGRLIRATRSGTVNAGIQANYNYDNAGNRTNVTVTGPSFSVSNTAATEGAALGFTVTRTSTGAPMSVNYATSNGTAAAGSDYTAASGTLNFAIGETSKPVSVATINDSAVESAETVTLTLSNPVGAAIAGGSATGTINDNDVPPAPSFLINDVSVTEGGNLVLAVSKAGTTSSSFNVNFATANGTATSGSDYTATSGTLTFAAADTTKTITIATVNDIADESNETVLVNLSGATGGATISDGQGIGTIEDNDLPAPSFSINDVAVTEGGNLEFTVTKAGTTSASFSVNFATANGTAVSGSDYTAALGALTFAIADTTKTIVVATGNDSTDENNETVVVNLSGATDGATITDSQGVGTINDNDDPPPATLSISDGTEVEGQTRHLTVTRGGNLSTAVGVSFSTANNTAVAGTDYNATSGTLSFAANETSKTISVYLRPDVVAESTETFFVNLSGPTGGATITDSQAVVTILDDPPPEQCYDEGGRPIPCD